MRHPVRSLLVVVCLCALPRLAAASECALPDLWGDTDATACDRLDYESPYVVDMLGDEPLWPSADAPARALERAPCSRTPDLRACPAPAAPRHLRKLPAVKIRVVRRPPQQRAHHHHLASGSIGDDEPLAPTSPPAPRHDPREIATPAPPHPLMPPGAARFALGHDVSPQSPPAARLERPPRAV